jgi:hypothetical protein
MKAMLEPRMVAANTHGRDSGLHEAAECPDRMTPSSHGCRIKISDLKRFLSLTRPGESGRLGSILRVNGSW